MSRTSAYDALIAHRIRISDLEQLQSLATWDRMTYMPPKGATGRARAQAALAGLLHELESDPSLDALILDAREEDLGPDEASNLALIQAARRRALAVPDALVQQRTLLAGRAGQAWTGARTDGGWRAFRPALEPLVDCVRETALRVGDALELSAYDALMDTYERGARLTWISGLFDDVASWLPDLIARVTARQADRPPLLGPQTFGTIDERRTACERMMQLLGFDFTAGRLDDSAHPFTVGGFDDVRLTTRFGDPSVLQMLLGVAHETGHGRYHLGLPLDLRGQPLGEPCSASMHEAQAITFERQITPTRGFLERLSPILMQTLGEDPAYGAANLRQWITTVRPTPVRVSADALTYPIHVILRLKIEAALITGDLAVADVPELWSAEMRTALGVDVDGGGPEGALQDIHWAQGMFGYFPSYLLGALISAQLTETFRRERGDADLAGEAHDLDGLAGWLAEKVWRQGARHSAPALVELVTGAPLASGPLRSHFEARYLS